MTAQQILSPEFEVPSKPENGSTALMRIIERATFLPDFDVAKMQSLFELKTRYEADEARKAFVVAMNRFKSDPPRLVKNKHVEFGNTKYDHLTLDAACDIIGAALSKEGISYRWVVEQQESRIKVTCVLTHEFGHSESTALEGPADTSGSKNPIQAVGSAVTYLQRYTLLAATGLAATGQDNDGTGASNNALFEQIEWIENACNLDELQKLFKQAYQKFQGNATAQKAIIVAKDRKKQELGQ